MNKLLVTLLIILVCTSLLSGCASMADATSKMAGLGVLTEKVSTFDNATIVEVSPNWLYDPHGSWGNRIKLGARWSDKSPEYAALILAYSSDTSGFSPTYIGLERVDINIDGNIRTFTSSRPTNLDSSSYNSISKTIYTQSKNTVVLPFIVIEEMAQAEDCRIRIYTSDGYEDADFSIERMPGGQGTAILSIRQFIERVRSKRQEG